MNEKVNILCENYSLKEEFDTKGNLIKVVMSGDAITFHKPTRNRISYKYENSSGKHKSLIGKPFLDTHNDSSIRTHPPFGHVINSYPGVNEKNGLPSLKYEVDIDPEEKQFIRKAKRKDIPGVSIQVVVSSLVEKSDNMGDYLEATIVEYLELSAVLIPGDGDSSIKLKERFNSKSEAIDSSGVWSKYKDIEKEEKEDNGNADKKNENIQVDATQKKVEDELFGDKVYGIDIQTDNKVKGNKMEEKTEEKLIQAIGVLSEKIDRLNFPIQSESLTNVNHDKEGKLSGNEEDKDYPAAKKLESLIRRIFQEEMKGVPERPTGHEQDKIGPKNTSNLPASQQPASGVAPSGGGFDSNDKWGDKNEEEPASKPKKDYDKLPIKKNSIDDVNRLIEQAKTIMEELDKEEMITKEFNGPDPSKPNPGAVEKDPKEMDGAKPKKGDSGFKENTRQSIVGVYSGVKKTESKEDIIKEYLNKNKFIIGEQ